MRLRELTGILLINLGTPADPSVASVRRYLRQFLFDPRIIELPAILRWMLVNLCILPFRSKKSAEAYEKIWTPQGSPLLTYSRDLQHSLQATLGAKYVVALGMRYGEPNIESALEELTRAAVQKILILPLFPQYSSAANGSALQQALSVIAKQKVILPFEVITEFYDNEHYIRALAESMQPYIAKEHDYILFSYHGLPERQMINPGISCYRTKCLHTSQLIANYLGLTNGKWSASFQSRLGKLPWIKPYTDQVLIDLRKQGVKRILIVCPSFIVDCLETLEEINIRAKQQWLDLGGESLSLIPCLNAQTNWVKALSKILGCALVSQSQAVLGEMITS
jgi:ferrochelatase